MPALQHLDSRDCQELQGRAHIRAYARISLKKPSLLQDVTRKLHGEGELNSWIKISPHHPQIITYLLWLVVMKKLIKNAVEWPELLE